MTNANTSSGKIRVLISGASIAGPALALWLGRYGYDVTVVERAAELRTGGSAVDYRGRVHRTVLERMGVLDQLRAHATDMGEQVLVDAEGWELLRLPASFMSGELEVNRGDLARVLYEASLPYARYVFGDSVRSLTERGDGVTVEFENGPTQEFDLVVGADGMHSMTRRLVFGEEREFRRDSGYFVSTFSAPNDLGLRDSGVLWNVPGRMVGLSNTLGKDGAMLVFHSPGLAYDYRDQGQQKRLVREHFEGLGWQVPTVLDAMDQARDFYFDSISQITMDRWSAGRVVLLGDAAWAPAPGGMGNGLAVVGAYILAGELTAHRGDHRAAFARYEELMRPYVKTCQKQGSNAGPFLAPPTAKKLKQRNRIYKLLCGRLLSGFFDRLTTKGAEAVELPDYGREMQDGPRPLTVC